MSRTTHRVVICASAIAAISLTGCSVSVGDKLNNPDKAITGLLHPTPKSVNCPSGISAKAGTTFTCKVVASDGTKGTVGVLEYKKGHIRVTTINGTPIGAATSTNSSSATGTGTGTTGTATTGTGTSTTGTGTSTTGTSTTTG